MSASSTAISQQQLIDAAKAPIVAFNDKDWNAVRASVARDVVYDEVATNRKAEGIDEVISLWQGWAGAFPDAKATFENAFAVANNVVLELRWRGTHKGPLQTPNGAIDATSNRIDVRACFVVEMSGDKPRRERHYFDMATLLQQLGVTA